MFCLLYSKLVQDNVSDQVETFIGTLNSPVTPFSIILILTILFASYLRNIYATFSTIALGALQNFRVHIYHVGVGLFRWSKC